MPEKQYPMDEVTIDGITLRTGDLVLWKDQTNEDWNGKYVFLRRFPWWLTFSLEET